MLVHRSVCRVVGRLVGRSDGWVVERSSGRAVGRSVGQSDGDRATSHHNYEHTIHPHKSYPLSLIETYFLKEQKKSLNFLRTHRRICGPHVAEQTWTRNEMNSPLDGRGCNIGVGGSLSRATIGHRTPAMVRSSHIRSSRCQYKSVVDCWTSKSLLLEGTLTLGLADLCFRIVWAHLVSPSPRIAVGLMYMCACILFYFINFPSCNN